MSANRKEQVDMLVATSREVGNLQAKLNRCIADRNLASGSARQLLTREARMYREKLALAEANLQAAYGFALKM